MSVGLSRSRAGLRVRAFYIRGAAYKNHKVECDRSFDRRRVLALGLVLWTTVTVRGRGGSCGRAHTGCNHASVRLDDSVSCGRLPVQSCFSCPVLQFHSWRGDYLRRAFIFFLAGASAAETQAFDSLDHGSHAGKRVAMKLDSAQSLDPNSRERDWALRQPSCRTFLTTSTAEIPREPGALAALAWDWPFPKLWWRLTEERSERRVRRNKARA